MRLSSEGASFVNIEAEDLKFVRVRCDIFMVSFECLHTTKLDVSYFNACHWHYCFIDINL